MNSPDSRIGTDTTGFDWAALKVTPFILASAAKQEHKASTQLYLECINQVMQDPDIDVHVLLSPGVSGDNQVYTAESEEDLSEEIETITGRSVLPMDMIVVIGRDVLDGGLTEDEMLEVAMRDVGVHINNLWPIADPEAGWAKDEIGQAAISATLVSAHEVIRMADDHGAAVERVKYRAEAAMLEKMKMSKGGLHQKIAEDKQTFQILEMTCKQAFETLGKYMDLPATAENIAISARLSIPK